MTRTLLAAAGAAALALSLPATAALADGVERRAPAAKPKPKPKPKAVVHHAPKPKAKKHYAKVKHHAPKYAALSVDYQERETVETSYYEERNGHVIGPVVSYSERVIAPSKGCYAHAPCGYSTGAPHGVSLQHGFHHGAMSGGVGYGVDGGPIYSFHGYKPGFSSYSRGGSSYRSHSSASSYGYGAYGYGHPHFAHPGAHRHSYGGSFGSSMYGGGVGAQGYTGFHSSPFGHGVGAQGYTGFQSVQPGRGYYNYGGR